MGQFIDLTAADGQKIPAYVAKPEGQPKGAVVVVQEIFGVNAHIREVADGYAKDGYVAVAPSPSTASSRMWNWATPTPTCRKALATRTPSRRCPRPA